MYFQFKDQLIHASLGFVCLEMMALIGFAAAMEGVYSWPHSKQSYFKFPGEDLTQIYKRLPYPQSLSVGPGETLFQILCVSNNLSHTFSS